MNHRKFILTFLFLFVAMFVCGQDYIVLQNRAKPTKTKKLKLDRVFTVKTNNTTYYSEIINVTDTTLSVIRKVKTDRDTTYTYSIGKGKDTTRLVPLYINDTSVILLTDIQYLQKDWFENRRWIEPFAWLGIGAVLGSVALPYAVFYKGGDEFKNWAILEGVLIGVSAPAIFIGTRTSKYDLKNKWVFQTRK